MTTSKPVRDADPFDFDPLDLDSRHLRLLLAVDEHRELVAAARSLGISPTAAAAQLRRSERKLGSVFDRTPDGLAATEHGHTVLAHVRAVLTSMSQLDADLVRRRDGTDQMRVTAAILPFEAWLPRLIERLPGLSWSVKAMPAAEGLSAVGALEADLFCGLRRVDDPGRAAELPRGVRAHPILHEPSWVRLPTTHPAAADEVVDLAALASEVWAVLPDPDLEDGLVSACRRAGFEPDIRFRPTEPAMKEELAIAGQAVSLTSPLAGSRPGMVLRRVHGGPVYAWVLAHCAAALQDHVITVITTTVREAYRDTAQAVPGVPEAVRAAGPVLP